MKSQVISVIITLLCVSSMTQAQVVEGTLLGTWSDPSLAPSTIHNNAYNEVWGLAVNGSEIAVIGSTLGTHFIDVTDPTNPTELYIVEGGTTGPAIIHRDFHDYKGYLYSIADEGSNTGLQIIDITQLPDTLEVVYDSREYFTRSHNIFIDTAKARLYSLISNGTAFNYRPMRIFDISNPVDPQPIKELSVVNGVFLDQVHDAFVRNDTAYLNLGNTGFAIVDFADIENPNVIGLLTSNEYPQSGYNHSGWLTEDGQYYYMADETFESDIKVLDLRSLPDIYVVNTFNAESEDISITHNQIVKGDKLYVSYYTDGLQVYDISDPENPEREMFYDTSTEPAVNNTYRGAWGVYPFLPSGNILVSDMQNGLFVVDGDYLVSDTKEVLSSDVVRSYPNPSSGTIHFDVLDESEVSISIDILDMQGKLIKRIANYESNTSIDLSNISEGIYNAILQTKEGVATQKFVLKR